MLASNTALVSSSTNSGFPSVLATICFITSAGSARPPVTFATMLSTSLRSRRPSVNVPTLGRPAQSGSNSDRKVNSARTGSRRTRSTVRLSSSREVASAQCRSSNKSRTGSWRARPPKLIEQCRQRPAPLLRRAERQRQIPLAERDQQQRSKKRCYGFNSRSIRSEDRFQLVEALLGRIVRFELRRSLQLGDERTKRAIGEKHPYP